MDDRFKELVTADSLIDTGRVPRRPAIVWLEDLRTRLRMLDHGDPFPDLSSIQNNISLLALLLRGPDQARLQCRKQIEFARHQGYAEEIIQPWINLARLDRIQRRHASAIKHLAPLHTLATGRPAMFAGLLVAASNLQQLASSVYATESFQWALHVPAYLSSYLLRLPELFATADHPAMAEQRIVAGVLLGDDGTVRAGLASRGWFATSQTRFVGMYYRAVYALSMGETRPRDQFLDRVAQVRFYAQTETDHAWLRLLHRSQRLASRSGCDEMAADLRSRTHALAIQMGDIEYVVQSTCARCAEGSTTESDGIWRSHAGCSGYNRFKGVPRFRADPAILASACAMLDEIIEDLDRIRGVTGAQCAGAAS